LTPEKKQIHSCLLTSSTLLSSVSHFLGNQPLFRAFCQRRMVNIYCGLKYKKMAAVQFLTKLKITLKASKKKRGWMGRRVSHDCENISKEVGALTIMSI